MTVNNNELIPGFTDEKDDSLKINLSKVDGVENALFVMLNGYIDTYNSVYFQRQVGKIVDAGYTKLVFNCANLNYVSSTGIGSFTSFLKLVKPKGGEVVLMNIQPKVYEVFQLLGFSQFFDIKESVDEAVSFLKAGPDLKSSVFPKTFECPSCSRRLKATKSGRFRCKECRTIIAIDQDGKVFLG